MRRLARSTGSRPVAMLSATALLSVGLGSATMGAAGAADGTAPVQDYLADQLGTATAAAPLVVMVHGTDIAAATAAVDATGMRLVTTFDQVGVAVAEGTADQIRAAGAEPGVTYLEGNSPIEFTLDTSNTATRGAEAVETLSGANDQPLDGTGVSVAVIDSGRT